MAPSKFGLFKTRSRDQAEQPSTENLLQSSQSVDTVGMSSVPSASLEALDDIVQNDMAALNLDHLDLEQKLPTLERRASDGGKPENSQGYKPLEDDTSTNATSTLTLQDEDDEIVNIDEIVDFDEIDFSTIPIDPDGASTSCDANSIQFDVSSITPSEDLSINCGGLKRPKKSKSKDEKLRKDVDMWHASNFVVMQNLLGKTGTTNDQIKWQAIATARGLCTLTDSCTCNDCKHTKYLAGIADGDGGLGAAPLLSAVSVGCSIQ